MQNNNLERTLVLIKPDAFAAHHTGDILQRYERAGFQILAMKLVKLDRRMAGIHYFEHIGRSYYEDLVAFMTSGPLIAMVLEGEEAIARVRELNGKTDPKNAAEGTIRKEFATSGRRNAVHASDSKESASREIRNFFNEFEIFDGKYNVMTDA